jgi:hypothetical protein
MVSIDSGGFLLIENPKGTTILRGESDLFVARMIPRERGSTKDTCPVVTEVRVRGKDGNYVTFTTKAQRPNKIFGCRRMTKA